MYETIVRRLLEWSRTGMDWYRFSYRRETDPFRRLCLTILLQRTRAERVDGLYKAIFTRYPTAKALAEADVDELTGVLRGIGLYRRKARRLRDLARVVVDRYGGRIPRDEGDLLSLPGVGRYTADIVRAICHGEDVLAIDVNVVRPFKRMGLIRSDREAGDVLLKVIPPGRRSLFSKILLEFGMSVCRPARPRCGECPMGDLCRYPERLPRR